MKRILLPILVIGILLLSACGAPATAPPVEAPPTPPPAEQPTPTTFTLSVGVSPLGAGSVSPLGGMYEAGTQVTLTATAASGYTFDYWDGDASGSLPTITITVDSNKSVFAHFSAVDITSPAPTPEPEAQVQILEHHLVWEDYGSFSMTFIRGKVKNMGDITLAAIDVSIWVQYEVEGLEGRVFNMPGSIDLDPAAFKPGEVRDFEVLVQSGAKENYDISVSIMPP